MNTSSKTRKTNKFESILLILIILEFISSLLVPSNRLKWFLDIGFYSILLFGAFTLIHVLLLKFSLSEKTYKEIVFSSLNIDNIFLAVSSLLLTINTITMQPAFESIESSPILSRYYILIYGIYLLALLISSAYKLDPIIKGIIPLVLFSFVTYSLPHEIHVLGYIPHTGIIIFLLFKLLESGDMKRFGIFRMPFDPAILLLFVIAALSTMFAFFPHESMKAFIKYSIYFMTYFIISRTFHRKDVQKAIFVIFLMFAIFLSSLFIYKITINALRFDFAVSLMFKMWLSQIHPNAVVIYTLIVLSLVIGFCFFGSHKILKLLLSLVTSILMLLIILTYSKTGYFTAIAAFFIILILFRKPIIKKNLKGLFRISWNKILILIVLILFLVVVFPKIKLRVQSRFIKSDYLNERLLYWELGSKIIKDHPLVGTGFRSYYLLSKYLGTQRYQDAMLLRKLFLGESLGAHIHNSYLELGGACGIFGFSGILWLLLILLKIFVTSPGIPERSNLQDILYAGSLVGSIALFVGAFFDHLLEFIGIGILSFIALGIVSSYHFQNKTKHIPQKSQIKSGKAIKSIIYSLAIFYFLIISSKCSALILFEMGKNAHHDSMDKCEKYFRILNIVDPLNWEYSDYLFQKMIHHANIPGMEFSIDKCFKDLKIAVEKNPHFAPGYRNLGYLYWMFGDLNQAKKCFQVALDLDPAGGFWTQHYADLALIEYYMGSNTNAFTNLKEAIKLNPLTVNADFWVRMDPESSPSQKIISPRFTSKYGDKYDKFIFQRILMYKITNYKKSPSSLIKEVKSSEKIIENYQPDKKDIILDDILKSIYNDYRIIKAEKKDDARTLLISLVSAYYHLGDTEMVDKLMKEEGLDYLPAINTRGIMIPGIDPFAWKEQKIELIPGTLKPLDE